jgi:hypothetical protein
VARGGSGWPDVRHPADARGVDGVASRTASGCGVPRGAQLLVGSTTNTRKRVPVLGTPPCQPVIGVGGETALSGI